MHVQTVLAVESLRAQFAAVDKLPGEVDCFNMHPYAVLLFVGLAARSTGEMSCFGILRDVFFKHGPID